MYKEMGSITLLLVIAGTYFHRKKANPLIVISLLLFAGLLNVYMGFRSLGGTVVLVSGFVALHYYLTYGAKRKRAIKTSHAITIAVFSIAIVFSILQTYIYAASEGFLGQAAQEKYEAQAGLVQKLGPSGLLIGGRPYFIGSALAIKDSPVLGHGSWANGSKYISETFDIMQDNGFSDTFSWLSEVTITNLIPTHSHFLGAWVDAGILGGIFWLWVLLITSRFMIRLAGYPHPNLPILAFIGVNFIWNILFSPLGAYARMTSAVALVVVGYQSKARHSPQSMS